MTDQNYKSSGYDPDGLREARRAFQQCCSCLRGLGVPLGVREGLTVPLGRWLSDEIKHAEMQEGTRS